TVAKEDEFWNLMTTVGSEMAYAYADRNPDLEAYMDDKTNSMNMDPLMRKYYASFGNTKSMYMARMYDELREEFPGIEDEQDVYFTARLEDSKVKPSERLEDYWDKKDALQQMYAQTIISFGRMLPEGPKIEKRGDIPETLSLGEERLRDTEAEQDLPEYYGYTREDWASKMSPELFRLVEDWAFRGAKLSRNAESSLEYELRDMDIDMNTARNLIRDAIRNVEIQKSMPQDDIEDTDDSGVSQEEYGRQESLIPKGMKTLTVAGKQYPILRTEMVDGKEIATIDMDGVEVTIGDEIEDTEDDIYKAYTEGKIGPKLYDYRGDDRLTDKTKDLLERNVIQMTAQQVTGTWKQVFGGAPEGQGGGVMFGLPEAISRREESGFRWLATAVDTTEEETALHELAHAFDYVDQHISENPEFIKDAQKYMREYEPTYPDTPNPEWFAMLFARTVTGSREVPAYIKKWFRPYIK
ncbi:hypothetical protein LCGC14_2226810, partial [marine sediment metagenome]